ncbi:MAG: VWA domain-containing protein, partial [Phycisphaerales bacterium]|nr:VWA domain-containing protein [Phycisphaerales bacterium]
MLFAIALLILGVAGRSDAAGLLVPTDSTLPPLRITDHIVDARIVDGIARTSVEQRFRNDTNRRLEATYIFPLPENADLTDFTLSFNGRQVKGEVLPATQAREVYESIVRQSRDPGLIEFIGRRLLRMRIFPVEPNSTTTITIAYQQICTPLSDMRAFLYPLRTPNTTGTAYGTLRFSVELEAADPIKTVWSPTHTMDVVRTDDRHVRASFERAAASLDDDFILLYDVDDADVGLSVVTYRPVDNEPGHFTLLLTPKQLWEDQADEPQDVVFVLDTSGSMAGEKIKQARTALAYCIDRLDPHDRFNVVRFSTGFDELFGSLHEVTPETCTSAKTWINGFDARGGTNIGDTLAHVLMMEAQREGEDVSVPVKHPLAPQGTTVVEHRPTSRPFVVVFLTDGNGDRKPEEIFSMLASANSNAQNVRLFSFAVGDDVNTTLIDTLASDYHGHATYIRPSENLELVLGDFFSTVSRPVLTNLQLSLPITGVTERFPIALNDLYHGGQLIVTGKLAELGHGPVTLTGRRNGELVSYTWDDVRFAHEPRADYVPSIWAGRKIAHLLDAIRRNGTSPELIEELVDLSVRYGIQTPYTSWFVNPEGVQVAGGGRRSNIVADEMLRDVQLGAASRLESVSNSVDSVGLEIYHIAEDSFDSSAPPASMTATTGATATEVARKLGRMRQADSRDAGRAGQGPTAVDWIAGRRFFRIGSVFVDERFSDEVEVITIRFATPAYFEF